MLPKDVDAVGVVFTPQAMSGPQLVTVTMAVDVTGLTVVTDPQPKLGPQLETVVKVVEYMILVAAAWPMLAIAASFAMGDLIVNVVGGLGDVREQME